MKTPLRVLLVEDSEDAPPVARARVATRRLTAISLQRKSGTTGEHRRTQMGKEAAEVRKSNALKDHNTCDILTAFRFLSVLICVHLWFFVLW